MIEIKIITNETIAKTDMMKITEASVNKMLFESAKRIISAKRLFKK
jgi:hypothetical protein